MKKARNDATNKMTPDPSAVQGIPEREPYEEFTRKDASFKKRRGAKK